MMRTCVFFESDSFPYVADECVNPHLYGQRLAEFLTEQLLQYGYGVQNSYPEDTGWEIAIAHEKFPLYIRCGNLGNGDNSFACIIEPNKPYIRRWFKKVATETVVGQLAQDLGTILRGHADIRHIRWE